jgi:D-alanine-D-alanine ligase
MNSPHTSFAVHPRAVKKTAGYIEIVASTNPRINAMAHSSQLTIQAVLATRYEKVCITHVNTMADLEALVAKKPDLVVLGMKLVLLDPSVSYDDSPKVWLAEYLSAHGINFTGSDVSALKLEYDKPAAKQVVLDAGLPSAAFFQAPIGQPLAKHNLRFPLFVKPTNRGDSKGVDAMSVVNTEAELQAKVLAIHTECESDALVEEYLPGREFSVAVTRQPRSSNLRAMAIEISSPTDAKGNAFLSEAVKAADSEKALPVTDQLLKNELHTLAIGVFKALDARDFGRIDMRLDADGKPCFMEANLMPGLSNHGYLVRCFMLNKHTSYEDMILSIVTLALERNPQHATIQRLFSSS